jgi:hypothetical protein
MSQGSRLAIRNWRRTMQATGCVSFYGTLYFLCFLLDFILFLFFPVVWHVNMFATTRPVIDGLKLAA